MSRGGPGPALFIGREKRAGLGRTGAGAPLPAGTTGHGKGKEGCHEKDAGKGKEKVGLDTIEAGRSMTARDDLTLRVHHLACTLPFLTEDGRSDIDLDDGTLHGTLGNAISRAGEGVVGVELPALVDEIILIHAIVTDEVAVLVRGIVNAQRAVTVGVVHLVHVGEGVLHGRGVVVAVEVAVVVVVVAILELALLVDLLQPTAAVVRLAGKIALLVDIATVDLLQGAAAASQVVVGDVGHGVEAGTVLEGGHLEGAALEGEDAAVVVAQLAAVGVGHVGQTSEGGGVLDVVDGPKMLGDLLEVLVEFLAVDADELPLGVGAVAVEGAAVAAVVAAEVLFVSASLVVGIDVLSFVIVVIEGEDHG